MSKLYSIVVRYSVDDEHMVRANSIEEAEQIVEKMIENGELMSGNTIDSSIDEAEIVSSVEQLTPNQMLNKKEDR